MFYLINTQGTTTAVMTEPIYQGSVGVNNITLFAPFPANVNITVYARLPNGLSLRNPYVLRATAYPPGAPVLRDEYGNRFTAFSGIIHESLTEYAGLVDIQFKVTIGVGKVLGTYTTSFTVTEGVITEPISIPTDEDYLNAVLQLLSEINSDPIKSVVYEAPTDVVLPGEVSTNYENYVEQTPQDTVAYIGQEQGYFVETPPNIQIVIGFEYAQPIHAQLLQFWMISPVKSTMSILVTAYLNDAPVYETSITINNTASQININPRVYIGSKSVNKIRFVIASSRDSILIKGIQLFKQNVSGLYKFTFNSGAVAEINAPDGETIKAYYEAAQTSAGNANESAINAASSARYALASENAAATSAGEALTYAEQAGASANSASTSAVSAQKSATEANNALQTIIGRRKVYYEANLALAIGILVSGQYGNGDIIVIGVKNVPDLFIFNLSTSDGAYALDGATPINSGESEEYYKNTITAGGKYTVNGTEYGVIAIESGIDTSDFVTSEELQAVGDGLDTRISALEGQIGNVQTALTNIIALQNSYINGGNTQ